MPMRTYPDDTELVETGMAMLFWVVFREQSIVLSYLPLANSFLSAYESLCMSVCRRESFKVGPVDVMGMKRNRIYIGTTSFEAALGQQLQVEKQSFWWQPRDVSAKDGRHCRNWTR